MVKQIVIHSFQKGPDPYETIDYGARVVLKFGDKTFEYTHTGVNSKKQIYETDFELPERSRVYGTIYILGEKVKSVYVYRYPSEDKDVLDVYLSRLPFEGWFLCVY